MNVRVHKSSPQQAFVTLVKYTRSTYADKAKEKKHTMILQVAVLGTRFCTHRLTEKTGLLNKRGESAGLGSNDESSPKLRASTAVKWLPI